MALTTGLQPDDFLKCFIRKALTSFGDVMTKAQKHMDCEDIFCTWVNPVPPEQDRDEKRDGELDRTRYRDKDGGRVGIIRA